MRGFGETDCAAAPPAAGKRRSSLGRRFESGRRRMRAGLSMPALALLVFTAPLSAAEDEEMALVRRIRARIAANAADKPAAEAYEQTIPGADVSFRMVPVPAGEFLMGSPPGEAGRNEDEGPQRRVRVDAFWMGGREVTWDEYRLVMLREANVYRDPDAEAAAVSSPTPPYVDMSFGMGIEGFPAISMTQHAASKYAQWLSAKTGHFYRLPTEAEWEYACRAGSAGPYAFGNDVSDLGAYAWFAGNSERSYRQAGAKKPNAWGLYDMHGNVWEWTLDRYEPSYPAAGGVLENPWAKAEALYPRAARGGSWADGAESLRCAARRASAYAWKRQDPQLPQSVWYHTNAQWLGFRLVRPAVIPTAEEMHAFWNSAAGKE